MGDDENSLDIGSVIRDNDPRMRGRQLTIVGFRASNHDSRVVFATFNGNRNINVKSIHTDGKPRKRGFSLVGHTPTIAPGDRS